MPDIREIKTNFTAGEVSHDLLGRGDLRAYENGALTLRNVFINPTGGVTRRAGLAYVDTAAGDGKLMAFEFSTEQGLSVLGIYVFKRSEEKKAQAGEPVYWSKPR